jgi:recombination protein RecA
VDAATGGGVHRGGISLLAGKEGTGKSRLAMDMIAYNQKIDPEFVAMYLYLEDAAFPYAPCVEAGIDMDRLLIVNARSSGEESLDIMMRYLWDWKTHAPLNVIDLIIIDSVAAIVPAAELRAAAKDGLGKDTVGRQAAMMSKALRITAGTGCLGRCHLLLIDQHRTEIQFGGTVLPGGKAVVYYPKITVNMSAPKADYLKRGTGDEQDKEVYGHTVKGQVTKNNTGVGKPHATFTYPVIYGEGVDSIVPLMDLAIKFGVIEQTSSAWFNLTLVDGTVQKINGKAKIEAMLRADPALAAFTQAALDNATSTQTAVAAPEAPESGSVMDLLEEEVVEGEETDGAGEEGRELQLV